MKFEIGEYVVLNEKIEKDYPKHSGDLVQVVRVLPSSPNYKYDVSLPNGDYCPVRDSELNKLTDKQKEFATYIQEGTAVRYTPTNEIVIVVKADYLHEQVEIEHDDNSTQVVCFETLKKLEKETDNVSDFKFNIGDCVKVVIPDDYWDGCEGAIIDSYKSQSGNSYLVSFTADYEVTFNENELELPLPFEDYPDDLDERVNSLQEELLDVFFSHYKNCDDTYTVPKELLVNMLNHMYQ